MAFSIDAKKDILALLMQDGLFFKTAVPLIPGDFFSSPEMRFIYEAYREFHAGYGGLLPREHEIKDILNSVFDDAETDKETREAVLLFVDMLYEHDTYTASYVKDKLYTFLTTHHMVQALSQAQDLLDMEEFDKIVQIIAKARNCATEDDPPLDYLASVEERIEERKYRKRKAIPTGFAQLDHLTDGGLPRGNIGLIVAHTGRGKTAIMGKSAMTACALGYKVLFITLELDPFVIADRLDSSICNIDIKMLRFKHSLVLDRMKKFIASRGPHIGKLKIQQKPARKMSVQDLDGYLEKLKVEEGFIPDVVFVDYADRMNWAINNLPFWQQLEHLMDGLRGIAVERNIALWTASQAKAASSEKEEVSNEDVGSSYAKTFPQDIVLTASQTKKEAAHSMMRLYISKSRLGGEKQNVFLRTNFDRMRFEELSAEDYEALKDKYGITEKKPSKRSYSASPAIASDVSWESAVGDV